ncbi:hypothetical protein GF402_01520 [Candidatus Fermentibacteria bacterium]|nr:hypothetical protein [Candidatus Fermentibacteria bacterium]
MTMDRAYLNTDEGLACCLWNASTKDDLKQLFDSAGAPYDRMVAVEEMHGTTSTTAT